MALTRLGLNQSINLATNTTGDLNLASQVTGTLPTGNGGTGATSFAPGKLLQTVNTLTSINATMNSTSFADAGLARTITCSATSSKVFGIVTMAFGFNNDNQTQTSYGEFQILRDSTSIQKAFSGHANTGSNDNYADYMNISRSTLNRKTKSLLGQTVNQLIIEVRLAKARDLLLDDPTASKKEIAKAVGASNTTYLFNNLKKRYGI